MSSKIEDAVRNARYNEAVIVTVADDEGGVDEKKREIVLVAALDKTNGGVSWQDAGQSLQHKGALIDIGIQRHLRTKIWMYPMLNDLHRNRLYSSSIQKASEAAIQNLHSRKSSNNGNDRANLETLKVLDIGSGTGFLAMLAAKCIKEAGVSPEVTSIEMASAMARLARKVIKSNDLDKNINLIEGHSCNEKFHPFSNNDGDSISDNHNRHKAILCTSELLETGLLGEGMIPAMRDAWDRHLAKDAIVVPQRARVYAQVVEGRHLVNDYCGPHYKHYDKNDNSNGDAKDNSFQFRLSTKRDSDDGQGSSLLLGGNGGRGQNKGVRVPIHAEAFFDCADADANSLNYQSPEEEVCPLERLDRVTALSESTLVLEFDFTCKDAIPSSSGRTVEKGLTAIKSGVAHGVIFWWELDLWDGETYSTEIGKSPWQDHWQQCLYVFADNHDKCERLMEKEFFSLITSHDDTSISFQVSSKAVSDDQPEPKRQRVDECKNVLNSFENHISHDRALQLNDRHRMNVLHSSIESAIYHKGKQSVILDISDFCLCALIAAKVCDAEKVTSLESSTGGVPYLSALVAQEGNQLPHDGCIFQVINAYAEHLTAEHLGGEVDIVMAEPYYEILESWHLQEALNYYYLLRSLKEKGVVKSDAVSLPTRATVMACAVELDDSVAKAHAGMQSSLLCGINHEQVTQNASMPSSYDIKFPAFQYKWKRLSRNFPITKIQFDGPVTKMKISGDGEWSAPIELESGNCHGIFVWVEYDYEIKGLSSDASSDTRPTRTIVSTGNRHHQQAFRFLESVISVGEGYGMSVKPSLNIEGLEDHDFQINVSKEKV